MPSQAADTVTNTQVTLVQIDNYGPWTVTPSPRREADLQTLQSRLFADLAQSFGDRDGYVFSLRFDNMIAVTNGVDTDAHARIQESIGNRYPVSVSFSVAARPAPAAALAAATAQLQAAGSAQDADRREILRGAALDEADRGPRDVQIAHFDVIDATGAYTDALDAFDSFVRIKRGYLELVSHLYREHDSLAFFVGGDNIIAAGAGLDRGAFRDVIDHVSTTTGVDLRVGVGRGTTAAAAGMDAKHALEDCRTDGTLVGGALPLPQGD